MIASSTVILKDGSLVVAREYKDSDFEKFKEFVYSLPESLIQGRFMQNIPRDRAIELLLRKGMISVIAERDDKVVAHGAVYEKMKESAEVGVIVKESFQSQGLGTALLALLAEHAIRSGIQEIKSYVSPENYRMIEVVRGLGFPVESEAKPGVLTVKFGPSNLPGAMEKFENRDAITAINGVKIFLEPKSIAVIGASSDRRAIGGQLFFNLLEANFKGPIFPINPSHDFIQGIRSYKSILDVEFTVDMALIAVPAERVVQVAEECGQKGVKGLVIISSGFSEIGEGGKKRQVELTKVSDKFGMRVIGPNCMGVINTSEEISMNGQFSPYKPTKGRVSFLSQSGALGIAIIDITNKLGIGMSSFVSVGNKEDISGNDLIQYWENDKNTDVILLYLESFGNPIKFSRIARRVTKEKPMIVVKSGRFGAGFRATRSHTGALLSASDVTVDALLKQSGVIRAETLDEMFEVSSVLAYQPIPKGNRVAILTNAGGAGILAADACESHGLAVPELSDDTKAQLMAFLPSIASVRNPVDMTAGTGPESYEKALEILGNADYIDSVIVIFIPPIVIDQNVVGSKVLSGAKKIKNGKTVVSVFMAYRGVPDTLRGDGITVPSFPFPEDAARALAKVAEYGKWKYSPPRKVISEFDSDTEKVKATISAALSQGREWLSYDECNAVLGTYGVPTVKTIVAMDSEGVEKKTQGWTGEVAIKAYGPDLVHKSDVGGVRLNIPVAEAGKQAGNMISGLRGKGFKVDYMVIQEMVQEGVEMIVGSTHDPTFGPLIVAGMGGKLVELLKDISTRLAPISKEDADDMISELRTSKLLSGYRGGIIADQDSYKDTLVKVSKLVYENPEIIELDLNPVLVLEKGKGSKAVDFRIRVGNPSQLEPSFTAKTVLKYQ